MTGYERVKNILKHKEVDRIPCDFQAEDVVWDKLKMYFEVDSNLAVLEHLDIDLRLVAPRYIGPSLIIDENGLEEIIVSGGPR